MVADPGSLGIVLGGSGNGEQIAANKVKGCRAALAWSPETATLAREHNNAQVIGIGARMHTASRGAAIVDAFVDTPFSEGERHARRIALLADYEATGEIVGLPGGAYPMPEGPTLHRLARIHQKHFGKQPVAVSSPQGRFEASAALVHGRPLLRAERLRQAPVLPLRPAGGARAPRAVRDVHQRADPGPQPRRAGCGCGWSAPNTADLRGPTACELITEPEVADVVARLGPDPLRRNADPELAWNRISKSRGTAGRPADAAGGDRRDRQRLPRRAALPAPPRPVPCREQPIDEADGTPCGRIWWPGCTSASAAGRIVVVRPEDDHGLPSYAPGRPRIYVYRRTGQPCLVCGTPVRLVEFAGRNVFWCPTCQS